MNVESDDFEVDHNPSIWCIKKAVIFDIINNISKKLFGTSFSRELSRDN